MQEPTARPDPAAKSKMVDPTVPAADEPESPAKQLSPEEQIARFEKELRENDWGHQPC